MYQTPNSVRGARTFSRSFITLLSLVGLGFHPPPGRRKTLSVFCLSVCLSVTHLFARFRQEGVGMILMPLDRERFVVVANYSSVLLWTAKNIHDRLFRTPRETKEDFRSGFGNSCRRSDVTDWQPERRDRFSHQNRDILNSTERSFSVGSLFALRIRTKSRKIPNKSLSKSYRNLR